MKCITAVIATSNIVESAMSKIVGLKHSITAKKFSSVGTQILFQNA